MAIWYVYVPIYGLHLASSLTTITVIYSVYRHDVLNAVAKSCLLVMYFSSFFTDIGYSFSLWCMITQGKILWTLQDVQQNGTPGACYTPLYYHELGFCTFAFGIWLTATERLINSKTTFYLKKKVLTAFIAIIIVIITGFCSNFWVTMILNVETSLKASIAAILFFLSAMMQLLLAVHFNIKSYQTGLGQSLSKRFESATLYYFNRQLLISLMGEVAFRLSAFSCIIIVSSGVQDDIPFGYLTLAYHNLIPVGNLVFPWLLILTRNKARRNVFRNRENAVTDLTGRQINMQNSSTDHYRIIQRLWS